MTQTAPRRSSIRRLLLGLIVAGLAAGWLCREVAFARERRAFKEVTSTTIALGDVKMGDYSYADKVVGKLGIYLDGDTPASRKFVTGRLLLDAGQTPHPPHTHAEEEVMIIESGRGEIVCGGKTTKVGPAR